MQFLKDSTKSTYNQMNEAAGAGPTVIANASPDGKAACHGLQSLPSVVEIPRSFTRATTSEGGKSSVEIVEFTELAYRGEGFVATKYDAKLPIHLQEIVDAPALSTPSFFQLPENSIMSIPGEALALSLETHTTAATAMNCKNIARITIVSESGERVLDTLIKPQTDEVALKAGIKSQLFKLSKLKAAPIEVVRAYVHRLIEGKQLVGYHLPQKMADFGLLDMSMPEKGAAAPEFAKNWKQAFDIAKIFNSTNASQQQAMSELCAKYLNLNYKKRPQPFFAFTEAKISMALYKQWIKLTQQMPLAPSDLSPQKELRSENTDQKQHSPGSFDSKFAQALSKSSHVDTPADSGAADNTDADEILEIKGDQLKHLIKELACQCVKEELQNAFQKLQHK